VRMHTGAEFTEVSFSHEKRASNVHAQPSLLYYLSLVNAHRLWLLNSHDTSIAPLHIE
jgi:hypothetical protein